MPVKKNCFIRWARFIVNGASSVSVLKKKCEKHMF